MSDLVLISITRGQARFLLKLLDGLQTALGKESPLGLRAIRKKVEDALYPGHI
ncbi:MAG: hypothetical protein K1W28_04605 [Lachnospiraceae bacterium]